MVESVESTLHRSRLKARPSSKPSSSPSMRSFQSNARHSFAASHPRLRIPRYFIVNSHESQCHHRIKEIFPLPLSGKQELVGICTSEELFPRSISTHHPYHRPSKRVTHQSPPLLRQICPYFTFDANRREITRGIGGEEFSGKRNDRKPRFIRIINIGSAADFQL